MRQRFVETHPPVYTRKIIGFQGYDGKDVFCVLANGDDHFLHYGIAENSILFVDPKLPYEEDRISVFQTEKHLDGQEKIKLSLTRPDGGHYLGRVILSVMQYT